MTGLPAWIGWPGTGPAPGRDWLPGPKLRFVILGLTYAFLALALTVNYAYSTAFFLLAIIGLYVGLRRGFVNGLTRAERLVMLAFAAYVGVAIASYLLGTRTNIGFRFLGRDLRLLFFIPVYLAVRWSRPRREHLVWALLLGAVGATLMAMIGTLAGLPYLLEGVTGTHIVFGDLAMLMGILALLLVFTSRCDLHRWRLFLSGLSILAATAGLVALILAHARGGMLALALVAIVAGLVAPWRMRWRLTAFFSLLIVCFSVVAGLCLVRYQPLWQAYSHFRLALRVDRPTVLNRKCINSRDLLAELATHGRYVRPFGASLKVVRSQFSTKDCSQDGYAMQLSNPLSKGEPYVATFRRSVSGSAADSTIVLAHGRGSFSLNGGIPKHVNASGPRFRKFVLRDSRVAHRAQFLRVMVLPRERLLVIPVQRFRGEYTYPLISNPTGSRLQMWHIALSGFTAHPVLGNGEGAFNSLVKNQIRDRSANPSLIGYQHPHNDILNALVDRGVLGLLAYLLVLFVPVLVLQQGGIRRTILLQSVALAGFGLTESMMIHSFVITYVIVTTSLLVTLGITGMREDVHE